MKEQQAYHDGQVAEQSSTCVRGVWVCGWRDVEGNNE